MEYAHERGERRQGSTPSKPVVLPPLSTAHWPQMQAYLRKRGLSPPLAEYNGWYPTVDRNSTPRIVIPAQSLLNTWPYYQARAMDDSPKRYDSPRAPRGDALVVCHPQSPNSNYVVLVEGPMDALAAAECGYLGTALMGNTPSDTVIDHIRELTRPYHGIIVLSDVDAVGEAVEVVHRLWTTGCLANFRPIKGYKDLAEVPYEKRCVVIEGTMDT
jgi:DNA primase